MTKKYAIVENKKVHIFPIILFTAGFSIVFIFFGATATLFGGDYLRYARYTDMEAKRCWL